MELHEKKNYIFNFILLGLSLHEAFYHVGLGINEIKTIETDPIFLAELEHIIRQEHLRLRELYKTTAEDAARKKLDWKAALSLLEVTFPEKYGKNSQDKAGPKKLELDDDDEKL